MVTEESGKKYQVGRILLLTFLKDTQENIISAPKKNIISPKRKIVLHYSIFKEYVTEERLEVPVEFDEGINNLLKKIEVVASISFQPSFSTLKP